MGMVAMVMSSSQRWHCGRRAEALVERYRWWRRKSVGALFRAVFRHGYGFGDAVFLYYGEGVEDVQRSVRLVA